MALALFAIRFLIFVAVVSSGGFLLLVVVCKIITALALWACSAQYLGDILIQSKADIQGMNYSLYEVELVVNICSTTSIRVQHISACPCCPSVYLGATEQMPLQQHLTLHILVLDVMALKHQLHSTTGFYQRETYVL